MISGDSIRVVHPLFHEEGDGAIPISPLQLEFGYCSLSIAKILNENYHSVLPDFRIVPGMDAACFAAIFKNMYYAAAIWRNPSSAMIDKTWLELSRFVILPDSPKNTASRMISWMTKRIKEKFPACPKLISYQDPKSHSGTIYKASNWVSTGSRPSGGFSSNNRGRKAEQSPGPKIRWEYSL